jgi:hypothetical protein
MVEWSGVYCNISRALAEVVAQAAASFFCVVTCCGLPGDDFGICRRWHAARIIWMAVAAKVGMPRRGGECAPRRDSFAVSRHSMVMHELLSLECFRHGIDAPRQCQWNRV